MIYFAQAVNGGPIKIGTSENPDIRKRGLSSLFPYGVEILATMEGGAPGEAFLHHCFEPIALRKEWFQSCSAIWRAIIELEETGTLSFVPEIPKASDAFVAFLHREFGGIRQAMDACGYAPSTLADDTILGHGLYGRSRARVMLAVAAKRNELPDYIARLHRKSAPSSEEAA